MTIPWEPVSFLMRNRFRVDADGKENLEELGGVQGRNIVIRIYYVMKKNLFSIKEK